MLRTFRTVCFFTLSLCFGAAHAASIDCSLCDAWNSEQAPFRIYGNTYYVGTRGLSSVLVTSPAGHVLIDGALPQSAPLIAKHVELLGFRMSDVKVILNSHAHFDHAGGIAELQRLSGASVIASDLSKSALDTGKVDRSDPQSGIPITFPGADRVEALGDRSSVAVGPLKLNVIHTPGHTRGGTTWTWQSCEAQRCLTIVYADSLNAVSDDAFRYSGDARYPNAAGDLADSIRKMQGTACDVLIAAHPEATGLWEVFDVAGKGDASRLVDQSACSRYGAGAKARLEKRLAGEQR